MRFWDSSALIPMMIGESTTAAVVELFRQDHGLVVWWATPVECISAIARRERTGEVHVRSADAALARLKRMRHAWQEVPPSDHVRDVAGRLLRLHPLRAADSLQLAAAVHASEDARHSLDFVTLDERLAAAASREGFPVCVPRV